MSLDFKSDKNKEVEQVEIFSIEGVPYSIPNKVKVNLQLKYLRELKLNGELQATYLLLETLLSPEGYEALMNYDDLTDEDFEAVVKVAQEVVFGAETEGKAQKKTGHK